MIKFFKKITEDKLWRAFDEKGTLLGTYIPNCLLESIISGEYKLVEVRILLFICRMSSGFQREETNYLGLEDFEDATLISKPHLSQAIRDLIEEKVIFRNCKNGNKYKYAINLLFYGIKMKHYKISNDNNEISNADSLEGNEIYLKGKSGDMKKSVIIYSKEGYSNSKKRYIKEDINTDKNNDIPLVKYKLTTLPKDMPTDRLLSHFEKEIKDYPNKKTISKYYQLLPEDDRYKIINRMYEVFYSEKKLFYELSDYYEEIKKKLDSEQP